MISGVLSSVGEAVPLLWTGCETQQGLCQPKGTACYSLPQPSSTKLKGQIGVFGELVSLQINYLKCGKK